MTDFSQVAESNFVTFDTVCGADVLDETGKHIGNIEDVIIDPQTGGLMAMLSVGGLLRRHAVAWSAMDYDNDKHGYVVHLDTTHKESSVTFDENLKWDGGYGVTLDSCFDVTQPMVS